MPEMRSRWIFGANNSVSDEATATVSGSIGDEAHIGLDGEARRRQRAALGDHIVAVEAEAVGQHQPTLDAAGLVVEAVVIEDAMHPFAAQLRGFRRGRSARRPCAARLPDSSSG